MSDRFDFESVLQDSLESLERGASVQDCLARFPEQADELAPLLETVVALRTLASPPPRSETARAAARARFLSAIEHRQVQMAARAQTPWLRWRERFSGLLENPLLQLRQWAPVLGGIFLAFLLINGTTRASANSLPGDWLYPIKLATEQIQLLITSDTSRRSLLEEEFQERRRAEAKSLIERGRRARVTFSGVIERVTPGALQVAGLTVRLGYETRIQGAPRAGMIAQVVAVSQSFGELIALEIEVLEPPIPTPTPASFATATGLSTPQPTPTRAVRPRVQIPQRRTRRAPVFIPTRPPRLPRFTPTPLPTPRLPTATSTFTSEASVVTATASPLPEEVPTILPSPTGELVVPTVTLAAETPTVPFIPEASPTLPPEETPGPVPTESFWEPTATLVSEETVSAPPSPTAALPEETPGPVPTESSWEPTATPVSEETVSAPPSPTAMPPSPPTLLPPTEPPPTVALPPPPTEPPPPPEPGEELPTPPSSEG